MVLKVGIIGPTNLEKLSKLTGKSVSFFLEKAKEIGKVVADGGHELWINGDRGMTISIGRSYKENKGKKLVVLYPKVAEPWPDDHIRKYKEVADIVREERNWFWANYSVVSEPDLCICVGLSAGTLSELAYIKWNHLLNQGKLEKLIAIKELLRGGVLPPEIEVDIGPVLQYIETTKELHKFL